MRRFTADHPEFQKYITLRTTRQGQAKALPRNVTVSGIQGVDGKGPKRIPLPSFETAPCVHEGTTLEFCTSCNKTKAEARHVRDCELHERATRVYVSDKTKSCDRCADYKHRMPEWDGDVLTLNEHNFFPELPGKRFNPALIEWDGDLVFCWRDGWKGSDLWAVRMDKTLQPLGRASRIVVPPHPECSYGREDPTLFIHKGSLHVSFVGVEGYGQKVARTNMMYARLGADFQIEESYYARRPPGVPGNRWEKNWQFVSRGDRLLAVYLVSPSLQVVELKQGKTEWVFKKEHPLPWTGGEVRGGATPVLHNGEYYAFFHDRVDRAGKRVYRVGCYTFDPDTFQAIRCTRRPLIIADPRTNPGNYCHCVFPRGAVLQGENWLLSCGAHDRFTEIRRMSAVAVESLLEPV